MAKKPFAHLRVALEYGGQYAYVYWAKMAAPRGDIYSGSGRVNAQPAYESYHPDGHRHIHFGTERIFKAHDQPLDGVDRTSRIGGEGTNVREFPWEPRKRDDDVTRTLVLPTSALRDGLCTTEVWLVAPDDASKPVEEWSAEHANIGMEIIGCVEASDVVPRFAIVVKTISEAMQQSSRAFFGGGSRLWRPTERH